MSRGIILVAALALTACPTGKKCSTTADCSGGQVCSVMSGTCVTATDGGGSGGGSGGGLGGGGGGNVGGGGGTGGNDGGTDGGSVTTTNNGAETCELAPLITPGTVLGDTTGMMDSYSPRCTGAVSPGPDTVYRISVPAGLRLSAKATPDVTTTANQYDLALYLIQSPASNCANPDGGLRLTCLGASDVAPGTESAAYFNDSTATVEVFIVVDSRLDMVVPNADGGVGQTNEGKFTLVTTLSAPAMGERCDTAITLVPGTPLTNQDLASFSSDYNGSGTGCFGSVSADVAYQVVVPAGQLLSLNVAPDMNFDPGLSISDSAATCGVTCLDRVDTGSKGGDENYTYKNTTAAAQTLFIVVDGYNGSSGTFDISATLSTPPADDTCAGPTALTSGTMRSAQVFATYANDYGNGMSTGCAFADGQDRVYSVAVPAGQRVTVTVNAPTADPALNLVDGAANCDVTCLASEDPGFTGDPETLVFSNTTGAPQNYLVVVDFWAGGTGTFSIIATVGAPPAGDVCADPTPVSAGTPLSGQSTLGYSNDYVSGTGTVGCTSSGSTTGPDRVYQVSVPAHQRGTVTVSPDGGFNPSINLVEGAPAICAALPRVCAVGANATGTNEAESVSLFNTTSADRTFFAIVDGPSGGDFVISYATGVPGTDDTCTTNTTLAAGTQNHNLTGFTSDYSAGTGCLGYAGPDRVYKVTLATNQKFTFTATPTGDGGLDPVISFIPGPAANCEATPRTCRGGMDATMRNEAETGAFTNNTAGSLDLFVVMADYETSSTNRDYTFTSSVAAATAGESCGLPQVVTAGVTAAQTTAGASSDVVYALTAAQSCVDTGPLPDKVYSVSVPAGKTLTVTATPAAQEDLLINIIDGPASTCSNVTACAASANAKGKGLPEVATFLNATAAAKIVFVQVSGLGVSLNYSLTVAIQ